MGLVMYVEEIYIDQAMFWMIVYGCEASLLIGPRPGCYQWKAHDQMKNQIKCPKAG